MYGEKMCCICQRHFVPHPSLKDRQRTCAAVSCRKELKRRTNKRWREQNPDYFRGRYETTLKDWYEKNGTYKQRYRQGHPEYRNKNVLYLKAYRQKKVRYSGES
jgi:hypothetical protein